MRLFFGLRQLARIKLSVLLFNLLVKIRKDFIIQSSTSHFPWDAMTPDELLHIPQTFPRARRNRTLTSERWFSSSSALEVPTAEMPLSSTEAGCDQSLFNSVRRGNRDAAGRETLSPSPCRLPALHPVSCLCRFLNRAAGTQWEGSSACGTSSHWVPASKAQCRLKALIFSAYYKKGWNNIFSCRRLWQGLNWTSVPGIAYHYQKAILI